MEMGKLAEQKNKNYLHAIMCLALLFLRIWQNSNGFSWNKTTISINLEHMV
jgi:hypothetical protein